MKKQILIGLAAFTLSATSSLQAADMAQDAYANKGYTAERFHAADTDADGFLSLQEASAAITKFEGIKGKQRFERADTNADGLLSLEEAAARKAAEKKHGAEKSKDLQNRHYTQARFNSSDTNGDGYLSREEARAGKKKVDVRGSKRFDKADSNGDGKLSLEEATGKRDRERENF